MGFRRMRRNKQLITVDECESVLNRNATGILSVIGDEGYPYGVPLNYVYTDSKIFFHCAKSGHKIDAVKNCNKVSFCVVDQDEVLPEKYTTKYRSVIIFGKAKILKNQDEIRLATKKLTKKYSPLENEEGLDSIIDEYISKLCLVEIEIEHISGKVGKELI